MIAIPPVILLSPKFQSTSLWFDWFLIIFIVVLIAAIIYLIYEYYYLN